MTDIDAKIEELRESVRKTNSPWFNDDGSGVTIVLASADDHYRQFVCEGFILLVSRKTKRPCGAIVGEPWIEGPDVDFEYGEK